MRGFIDGHSYDIQVFLLMPKCCCIDVIDREVDTAWFGPEGKNLSLGPMEGHMRLEPRADPINSDLEELLVC